MAINTSGAVLMEPLSNGRRPGPPPTHPNYRPGPPMSSSSPNGACPLPPVQQHSSNTSMNTSGGAWRGPMPPPGVRPGGTSSSPRSIGSNQSPPMMLSNKGQQPMLMPPHPPNGVNHSGPNPRPMSGNPQPSPRHFNGHAPPPGVNTSRPYSTSSQNTSRMTNQTVMSNNSSGQGGVNRSGLSGPTPQQQQQQQQRRSVSGGGGGGGGRRVPSVARGPQPTCVEPTRLRDGRKIKDLQRQQPQPGQEAHRAPHRFTGPGKNGMQAKNNNNNADQVKAAREPKPIKTTVGNDESWVKGLTYSTWIDSPRGSVADLDSKEGPYKRQGNKNNTNNNNNRRRKARENTSQTSNGSGGGVLEMLRNLFR